MATESQRDDFLTRCTEEQLEALVERRWEITARPEQLEPEGDWFIWYYRAGRGAGKTRSGSEATRQRLQRLRGMLTERQVLRWFLAAPTRLDVRETMIEGETGLAKIIPPSWVPQGWDRAYNKTDLTIDLAGINARIRGFSSERGGRARGPQFHGGWADEPGEFADAHLGLDDEKALMANLFFGLRLPPDPRLIVTGTPKNNRLIKDLRKMPGLIEVVGKTSDNLHNLSPTFRRTVVARYRGRRLGRQELDAEILEGVGQVFQRGWFQRCEEPPWPAGTEVLRARCWDLASGEESDGNPDPDWTAGALVSYDPTRRLYLIEHITRFRLGPGKRDLRIARICERDGLRVTWMEKEPGNAGLVQLHHLGAELERIGVRLKGLGTGGRTKEVRADLLAGAAEQGRVFMLDFDERGAFLDEGEEFPTGAHDDMIDAASLAPRVFRARKAPSGGHAPSGRLPDAEPDARRARLGRLPSPQPARR